MKNLVSAQWLNENLDNQDLVLIDCRFDLMNKEYGKISYEKSHIKGAVRIDIETQLAAHIKEHGGRHPLPSIEELKSAFEDIGISNESIVVCYDDGDLAGPARLWWILKYLGHEKVYVLQGGMNVFKEISDEITSEIPKIKKGNFEVNINEDMNVEMNYIKERLYKEDVAIIDSRESRRYNGEFEPVHKKSGHIPSALNYFWLDVFDNEDDKLIFKSINKLENHFKELKKYDEIIIYCGSGITACVNSLALSEININHKVYSGSFSDWISYDENEIKTCSENID